MSHDPKKCYYYVFDDIKEVFNSWDVGSSNVKPVWPFIDN